MKLNEAQQELIARSNGDIVVEDIPKDWWSASDLDEKMERNRLAREARAAPQLPASAPRRKANGGNGYVTHKELDQILFNIGKSVREFLAPLAAAVQMLEERPEVTFGDTWKPNTSYAEKCLVSHQGGLWLSKAPNNETRPGSGSPSWRLVVKRGVAG
jgi:hypothetical protein